MIRVPLSVVAMEIILWLACFIVIGHVFGKDLWTMSLYFGTFCFIEAILYSGAGRSFFFNRKRWEQFKKKMNG